MASLSTGYSKQKIIWSLRYRLADRALDRKNFVISSSLSASLRAFLSYAIVPASYFHFHESSDPSQNIRHIDECCCRRLLFSCLHLLHSCTFFFELWSRVRSTDHGINMYKKFVTKHEIIYKNFMYSINDANWMNTDILVWSFIYCDIINSN